MNHLDCVKEISTSSTSATRLGRAQEFLVTCTTGERETNSLDVLVCVR